ncbi:MAG: hypothetical protein J5586_02425 [Clostridia bacterium]|nr:hypothetical protein [Clostridia bacterium]
MNRYLKKGLALLITAVMLIAVLPELAGASSSSSHVSISVSPKELAQAGTVTVSITLKNTNSASNPSQPPSTENPTDKPTEPPTNTEPPENTPEPTDIPNPTATPAPGSRTAGNGDYTNITISNSYGVTFSTNGVTIPAGSSKSFTAKMNVSDGMIGIDIPFTVTWNDNGTTRSETVSCRINRRNVSPYLSVSRTATPVNASEGTEVTFKYTFTNTGAVTLVNIALVDRYVYGSTSAMYKISSLEPGASKEFEYVLTMGKSTIVSAPVVTFYAQGGSTQLVNNVSALTIGLIQSQITKEIVKGTPTPEGVQFTLYLTNNGNQKLSALEVKDEKGNKVSDSAFSLAVGETKVLEYFVPNPTSVRYVVFTITGEDYNGTAFKDNTESFVVRPYIDTSLLGLSFTAVTTSSLNEENTIGIQFSIVNTGALEFFNLSVTERSLGYEIHKWSSLGVGASDKVDVDVNIGAVRDLVFILTAEDSSGNKYEHEAYITAENIDVDALVPTQDPNQNDDPIGYVEDEEGIGKKLDGMITNTGEKLMKWFRVLGVIAAVAAVAMLSLGIAEIVIRRSKRSNG